MTAAAKAPPIAGALSAVFAVFLFSINDVSIKFLSGTYALHEVVLIRSVIALAVFGAVILPLAGGVQVVRTKRLGLHLIRGGCVVFANMAFFMGVAAMPLAEAVAIFFVSPLLITVFSVVFLGETVGPRRWAAIGIGLLGVLVVLRPGTSTFQFAALLPLAGAFGYATLHTLTRKLGATESAAALTFYIQVTFIAVAGTIGLALGGGQFAGWDNASLEFFFRAWTWPAPRDWAVLGVLGLCSVGGGYFISQAYRLSEAALVAPFEYVAMPLAVLFGLLLFDEWPDPLAWIGILLIVGSGLFLIWRESAAGAPRPRPRARR